MLGLEGVVSPFVGVDVGVTVGRGEVVGVVEGFGECCCVAA